MAKNFRCIVVDAFRSCASPVACEVFGYCRTRNFDGNGMSEAEIARRKAESDSETNQSKIIN